MNKNKSNEWSARRKRNAGIFCFFALLFKSSDKFTYIYIRWWWWWWCYPRQHQMNECMRVEYIYVFKLNRVSVRRHWKIFSANNCTKRVSATKSKLEKLLFFWIFGIDRKSIFISLFTFSFYFLSWLLGLTRTSFIAGSAINVTWHLAYAHRVSIFINRK